MNALKQLIRRLSAPAEPLLLFLLFIAMLAINGRFLWAELHIDDFGFLFNNPVIRQGKNPLLFWTRGHAETKSWPLFYTVEWILFQSQGSNFIAYHAVNLIWHTVNGLLLYLISRRAKFKFPLIATAIFWLHPITVETVSWIFQLSKILTTAFLLAWLVSKLKPFQARRRLVTRLPGVAAILGGVLTSGQSYLMLPLELFHWRQKWQGASIIALGFGGAALLAALLTAGAGAMFHTGDYPPEYPYFHRYQNAFDSNALKQEMNLTSGQLSKDKSHVAAYKYLLFFKGRGSVRLSVTLWCMRIASLGLTATHYVMRFLFPLQNQYPSTTEFPGQLEFWLYFVLGITLLILTFMLFVRNEILLAGAILTYLPSSGLFYFPYLQFSFVSDRYAYVPLAFIALFFASKSSLLNRPWKRAAAASWIFMLFLLAMSYAAYFHSIFHQPLPPPMQL